MSHTPAFPRRPSDEADEANETRIGVWTLVWTIYLAKVITIMLIFWAAHSFDTATLIAATTWIWLGPAIALAISPALFRLRLHRVRARRDALQRSEWMLPEPRALPHQ